MIGTVKSENLAVEVAQLLRAVATLAEDPGSDLSST